MEMLLRDELNNSAYKIDSAGVRGFLDAPMDGDAAVQARNFGINPAYFRSRTITADMVETSGLILTASREHRSAVLTEVPTALRRTFTLLEFAQLARDSPQENIVDFVADASRHRSYARGNLDIEDPYRKGELVHRQIAERIKAAVDEIAAALNSVARVSKTHNI